MRLVDYAKDRWSQFGEDGMLEQIFKLIGEQSRFCVEFGAADGVSCSNTKRLREAGWSALLIEADAGVFSALSAQASAEVRCVQASVTPYNVNALIREAPLDFMSIDVDGDDYAILEVLKVRPRVVCVEYNASIPPHVALRQAHLGAGFGASALALCQLAGRKGYELVGLTKGNLVFVRAEETAAFVEYERGLEALYDKAWLTYLVTDYAGRPVLVGQEPPWGLRSYPFVGATVGEPTLLPTRLVAALRAAFESVHGPSIFLGPGSYHDVSVEVPDRRRQRLLREALTDRPKLVMVDISNHAAGTAFDWIEESAGALGYQYRLIDESVIVLVYGEKP